MIVKEVGGKVIDTNNMDNNHLILYVAGFYGIRKIEVNFELAAFEGYMKYLHDRYSVEKEDIVPEIKFNRYDGKPIPNDIYHEILDFSVATGDIFYDMAGSAILDAKAMNIYLKWLSHPKLYREMGEWLAFKRSLPIEKEKEILMASLQKEINNTFTNRKIRDFETERLFELLDFELVGSISGNEISKLEQLAVDNKWLELDEKMLLLNKKYNLGSENGFVISVMDSPVLNKKLTFKR